MLDHERHLQGAASENNILVTQLVVENKETKRVRDR